MKLKVIVLYGALLSAFAASAFAAPLTIHVKAHVRHLNDPGNLLGNQLSVGQVIDAEYTYDTAVTDQDPNAMHGNFPQSSLQAKAKITAGTLTFETDPTPSSWFAEAHAHPSEFPGSYWSYFRVNYFRIKPLNNGARVDSIFIDFSDRNGYTPSSESILTTAPDLQRYTDKSIDVFGGTDTNWYSVRFEIDSITVGGDDSNGPIKVSPLSGSFLRMQRFDAAVLLPPGTAPMSVQTTVNGMPGPFNIQQSCFPTPPNSQGRPALFCPDAAWRLMDGTNHIEWRIQLMDGTMLEKSVDWEVIP